MSSRYAGLMNLRPVPFKPKRRPPVGAPLRKGPKTQTKSKYPVSKTKTVTKYKKRKAVKGLSSDKGVSFFSYSKRAQLIPKTIYKSMVGNQQMLLQAGFQLKGTVGRQAIAGLNTLAVGTRTDLLAIRDKVIPLVSGVRDTRSAKIFLRSARNVIHMRNQTNAPIKIKLFDIMCKRSGTGAISNDPISCWSQGVNDDTQDTTGVFDYETLVGQMPGQSPEFRTFYSIKQERVLELQPGAFHEHFFKINYNRMWDTTYLDNMSTTADNLAGWTFNTVIVAYGSIGSDSATGTGAVTYLPVSLDICYNKVYKYGYLEKNLPKYDIVSTHNNTLLTSQIHSIVSNDFVAAAPTTAP